MPFDIIGDLHGNASKLQLLLKRLGYRISGATWHHTERQAIFLGDFIDRGPEQLETCDIVRNMIAAGSARAVMGNHEFNAIAWFLKDPDQPGDHLRRHTEKNRKQHECFLREVEHTPRHKEMIDWFLTLPLWLELDGLRVVHACWHPGYIADIEPYLEPGHLLSNSLVKAGSREGTMAFRAIEGLLKGLEAKLPEGLTFLDKGGHTRSQARVRWWNNEAPTSWNTTLLDDFEGAGLQNFPLPANSTIGYRDSKPVFIGHYSLSGHPALLTPKVACVDYYNKIDNPLVAYRWDGEEILEDARFVIV
jgi:hypothetical protein